MIVLALLVLGLSPHASKICVVGDFSQTHLKEATFGLWIGVQKEPRYGGDRRLKGTPISMV
ncbi:MAG: hypothetical protein K2X07_12510, partial [Caulobacteraceae bacterium]|nr:hypothetical protein [Caulobacteraceae bacterium]